MLGASKSSLNFSTEQGFGNSLMRVGGLLYLGGVAGLGAVEMLLAEPMAGFHPNIEAGVAARLSGGALIIASLFSIPERPMRKLATTFLALLWAGSVALILARPDRFDVATSVAVSEALLMAATAFYLGARTDRRALAMRLAFAAMLLLFGAVHLTYRSAISAMIPAWLPAASLWPWATGGVMLAAGLISLSRARSRQAGLIIAAMFSSWIPLVHLARIVGNIGSAEEWTFALTAVSLIGAALVVATVQPEPSNGQFSDSRREGPNGRSNA